MQQSAHHRLTRSHHDRHTAKLSKEDQDRQQLRNTVHLPANVTRIPNPVSTIVATLMCPLNHQIAHPPPQTRLPFPTPSISCETTDQHMSLHDQYPYGLKDAPYGTEQHADVVVAAERLDVVVKIWRFERLMSQPTSAWFIYMT